MKKVVVIDDSEINCILAQSILEENYTVDYFTDPLSAIEELKVDKPNLVLLDVMMPGMDGVAFLKRMKQDEELKDIPVIMVSALSDDQRIEDAIKYGAIDVLPKPIGNNGLLSMVNHYLL